MTKKGTILCVLIGTVVVITFLTTIGAALQGSTVAMGRSALALVGAAGTVLVLNRRSGGWHLLLLWALVQIPIYAWSPEGAPNLQLLRLGAFDVTLTRGDGEYRELGLNLGGLVWALWLGAWRRQLE